MTTAAELITRTIREIESKPGYSYDRSAVEAIINAGTLPDGTVFMGSKQTGEATFFQDRIEVIKDGKAIKTMPMSEQAREAALIVHAKNASRRGSTVGRI